jgi:hypothetical protein
MTIQNIKKGIRTPRVTVDLDNFKKLGEIEDDIFISGLQWFGKDSEPIQCIIVFDMETFYRALKNWYEVKKNDHDNDRIVGITRLEKYKPGIDQINFIECLPDLDMFRSIDFIFLKK